MMGNKAWEKKGPMDAKTANMLMSKFTFEFDQMVSAIEEKKTNEKLSVCVIAEVSIDSIPYQIQLAFVPKGCEGAIWLDPDAITTKK